MANLTQLLTSKAETRPHAFSLFTQSIVCMWIMGTRLLAFVLDQSHEEESS